MIESMEREEEEVRGEISLYTNESLVAIVRMEFRTVIKPIGVTSVSIGGLLPHSFSFLPRHPLRDGSMEKIYIPATLTHRFMLLLASVDFFFFLFFVSFMTYSHPAQSARAAASNSKITAALKFGPGLKGIAKLSV